MTRALPVATREIGFDDDFEVSVLPSLGSRRAEGVHIPRICQKFGCWLRHRVLRGFRVPMKNGKVQG
jgi:hypothetical protein